MSETGPVIEIFPLYSIFKKPSLKWIFVLVPVKLFSKATTPVAQAAVPHALVNPAPLSHTFTKILLALFFSANVIFIFSGNSLWFSINGPIFFINNIENFNLEKIGPEIENDKLFPEKCNITLAKIISEDHIKVRVWERGAGLTKACGTAACATAYAAKITGKIKNKTEIEFELGKLSIFIDRNENISMKGPVSNINQIEIKI